MQFSIEEESLASPCGSIVKAITQSHRQRRGTEDESWEIISHALL